MTPERAAGRLLRFLGAAAVAAGMAVCLAVIVALARDVQRQVDELAVANSDSWQWSMAQADVEVLALYAELLRAELGEADLEPLRRRYDVLYGRITLLDGAPFYNRLRQRPEVAEALAAAGDFLARTAPTMDGDDDALRAALPALRAETEVLRPILRDLTLAGHRLLTAGSDARRETVRTTLQRAGGLTLVLVLILIAMVVALAWLARQARARAEQQAQTRARLQAIIATSLDAILVVDRHGRILDFNGAAETLFGRSRDEALAGGMAALLAEPCAAAPAGPAPGPHRVTGLHRDGTRFPAECSVGTTDSPGGPVRVLFLHDISDRLAAEEAMVEARDRALAGEKAKADMLAVMSHEMRTPLNGILGTLDLMADTGLTPRQRDCLRIIRGSGELLLDHVNDVLDISRLDAGKMPVARLAFDAGALLRDLAESQRPAAEAQGNRIVLAPGTPAPGWALGDATRLRQVLLNLLGNAVKFTRGGRIALSARRLAGDMVEYTVRDTGIGIPARDLGRIFEDFVTLDSAYDRATQGSGLGLPIARRMAQAMGGTIAVESTEGKGSLFRLTLPLPPADPAAPGPPAPPPPMRVLVVEDNPINRFVVVSMLEGDGHRVDTAATGAEGLALAEARRYDLILMDIAMPHMDGIAATRAIRAGAGESRLAPIIALTAHALPEDLRRFEAAGMSGTLVKPLEREGLRDLLAGIVRDGGPPVPAQAGLAILDRAALSALRADLGPATFAGLFERYLDETGRAVAELAAARDDPAMAEALAQLAHRQAGSAALFGARRLHRVLVALEAALRSGPPERIPGLSDELEQVWHATKLACTGFRQPVPQAAP